MPAYADSVARTLNKKLGEHPSVLDFGGIGDDTFDNTEAFHNAVDALASINGGELFIPRGVFRCDDEVELKPNVRFVGEGRGSIIKRGATLADGKALISVTGDDAGLFNLAIDGDVTTPAVLKYSDFSSNPMHADLLRNTSVYVRPGKANFTMLGVTVFHTGGYAVIMDADSADVRNVLIEGCLFEQNRPHIWETEDDVHQFGSWTGGVFYRGDCRASESKLFSVRSLIVRGCRFRRATGNQVWGHSWGFDIQHKGVIVEGCTFEDIGRDGILFGNVAGGSARSNSFRRIGYLTSTDSDTPAQNTGGDFAVAIDSSGYVSGVGVSGNDVRESSGAEAFDLDGFREGDVSNNQVDTVLIGVNTGDSQNNGAGKRITFLGNSFRNCGYSTIRLNDAEDCVVQGNTIEQPSGATEAPIQLNAITTLGCKNNLITGNRLHWDKDAYCVQEAAVGGTFDGTVQNRVFGNQVSGSNRGEFSKHANSGSMAAYVISTADPSATTPSESIIERLGFGSGAALRLATRIAGTRTEVAQFQDVNRMWLVGIAAGAGAMATGNRSTLIWGNNSDAMATGKLYADGFLTIVGNGITAPGWTSTFSSSEANAITTDQVGLIRYNAVTKAFEQSVAVSAGARVWSGLGGAVQGTAHQIVVTGTNPAVLSLSGDGLRLLAATGIAEAVLQVQGELAQVQNLQQWRKNDGTVLSAADAFGTFFMPALALRTDVWAAGSSSIEARFAARAIRFRQEASSEHADSGLISFRSADADALTLIGAGASAGVRLVRLKDKLVLTGAAGTAALTVSDGWVDSDEGFVTASALTNAIQAPTGGVTARFLIGTRSFSMTGYSEANAGLSTSGNGRIFFDTATGRFRVSENGGGYTNLLGGITGSFTAGRIPYTTGANSLADSANLAWDNANQFMVITGNNVAEPALTVNGGYIDSMGGLVTSSTNVNAIQAPTGGVLARFLVATRSYTAFAETAANAGLSTAGNGRIYFDNVLNKFRVSENGGAFVDLVGGGLSGLTAGRIPFTVGASSISDTANLTWDNTTRTIGISAQSNSVPAINAVQGFIQAAGGILSTATNWNGIQSLGGIRAGTGIAGDSTKVYVNWDAFQTGKPIAGVAGLHAQNLDAQAGVILDAYGAAGLPVVIGRKANGTIGAPSGLNTGDVMLVFGGRGWFSGGIDFSSNLACALLFRAANLWTNVSQGGYIEFATTPVGSTTRLTRATLRADGAFEIGSASGSGILGLVSHVGSPGIAPGVGFGGLSHNNGSTYWYWNGGSWATFNFAAGAGISSINSQTGPAISIVGANPAAQVAVSSGVNTITLSLPQNIATTSDVVFNFLRCNRAFGAAIEAPNSYVQGRGLLSFGLNSWNAIQVTDGGIAASTSFGISLIDGGFGQHLAIDFSGVGARFRGSGGVDCGSSGGISGAGFNPNIGGTLFTGYSSDASFGFGDVVVFSATVNSIPRTIQVRFTRGAVTFYSAT